MEECRMARRATAGECHSRRGQTAKDALSRFHKDKDEDVMTVTNHDKLQEAHRRHPA